MSKSEAYLDGLLNAATSEKDAGKTSTVQEAESIMDSEKKFLDDFEKQLLEDDGDDGFLLDFEKELNEAESTESEAAGGIRSDNQDFLDDLNGIVSEAQQKAEQKPQEDEEASDDFEVDTLSESIGITEDEPEQEAEEKVKSADDGMDFMSLFDGDEAFANLAGEANTQSESEEKDKPEEESGEETVADKETDGEQTDKKEGFFQKLGRVLFGEEEEEETTPKSEKIPIISNSNEVEALSDENMEILAALGGAESQPEETKPETEEEKKARLKKEKKEAKEKKKQEKKEAKEQKKKEKKPKEKKEKKPKKPKEKDNTPPLPKKPVILMFVMAASFLVLVMLGGKLMNYSSDVSAAQKELDEGNYTQAYEKLAGIEIKEADTELYQKTLLLASVQSQYEAYEIFEEYERYDLALDALISVIGRYDVNYEDAETYGCTVELGFIEQNAEQALSDQFGVTAEQAREMYGLRDREEYSLEVYKIIYALGLEKTEEE